MGIARALDGRVLLRLEDHDRGRCRPEYESALLEDLDWLGLKPDLGSPAELRQGAGQAAHLTGLLEHPRDLRPDELGTLFENRLRAG